jgi:hypothetical protein
MSKAGRPSYQVRALTKEEGATLTKLMRIMSDTFKMSDEFLEWKYPLNPDFDQSLVVVAVNGEQVVAGASWLPRNLKISRSLSVRAALGADLAVQRNHRGHGLAKPLIESENSVLADRNVVMSYGFVEANLVKHVHGPLLGLVGVPTSTTVYKKYLNLAGIQEKVTRMNGIAEFDDEMRRKLRRLNMSVLFRLRGIPHFTVRIGSDEISLDEGDLKATDLKVECDLALSDLVKSERKILTLVKALLTRRIRVKGSLKHALKLYSLSRFLRTLLA